MTENKDAFKWMQEFYLSDAFDPKAARHADVVQAAIAWTVRRLTHPEAQGNKDLGEPPLTRLEVTDALVEIVARALWDCEQDDSETARYANRIMFGTQRARSWDDANRFQPGPSAEFRKRARAAAKAFLQASAKHEAAHTLLIKGESELESASNGMGLR